MPEPIERRFQELVRPELAGLYSLAARLTADDPEDLVQECLLHAYRSRESLREPRAAGRWLRAILLNAWKDRLRKRGRSPHEVALEEVEEFSLYRKIAEDDPFPYSDSLHLDFLNAFGEDDVRAVLLRLPMHYRAPLVLRYMEGFATKEIAHALDTPLGTILARLHRGRKLFEKQMWEYAVEKGLLAPEGAR
jgi:RNA polymerase sigma-70 factor (ECF subfamily)